VATGDSGFVAVEFDTFNDTIALDPNATYDHIGIDQVRGHRVPAELQPHRQPLKHPGDDAVVGRLEEHVLYNLSHEVDLKIVLPENVSVGFSASTSVELHQLRSWSFSSSLEPKTVAPPPPSSPTLMSNSDAGAGRRGGGVVAGATVGAALLLVLLLAVAPLSSFAGVGARKGGSLHKRWRM
jgi:hypothetical protein